jgi:tetratricopeptide (TPR) repeat protein
VRLAFILTAGLLLFGEASLAAPFPVELIKKKVHSRLSLSIDSAFSMQWKDTPAGFKAVFPAATLLDFGVPLGQEAAFNAYLKTIQGDRLRSLSIRETKDAVVVEGVWRFPVGAQALADPKMDHFDFREEETGRLNVDFWYHAGPTVAVADLKRKQAELKKEEAALKVRLAAEAQRKAVLDKRIADSRNATAFCQQPFDRENAVFVRFRAEHPKIRFQFHFPEHIPDHKFEYALPKGDSEEEKMVLLAIKLYRENKHGLAGKTIEFLEKQYPESKHLVEMRFLRANIHFRLGLEEQGMRLLKVLSKEASGTEVGFQSAAFVAAQSYRRGDWLVALDAFMRLQREFPKHPLAWLIRYGVADSLYMIRQSDRAAPEFEWVAQNAPDDSIRAEAAFKVGNVYFDRGQYAQAIQSYSKSLKEHEKQLFQNSFVLLNLGESYFSLDELRRSQAEFERYLSLARAQPSAWRASLRVAEIKAMRSTNIESQAYMDAFRDTINRYPLSPGAVIARLRLIPCGDHGGFDPNSAARFFSSKEVQTFAQNEAIMGSQFMELLGLTEVRAGLSYGLDSDVIRNGQKVLASNPSIGVRKMVGGAIHTAAKRILGKELDSKDGMRALMAFEEIGELLPQPKMDPVSDEIRLRLAKIASSRKLDALALKIIEPYGALEQMGARSLASPIVLTSDEVVEQEERTLVEVKALWEESGSENAEKAQSRLAQIRADGPKRFERSAWEALFAAATNDRKTALAKVALALGKGTTWPDGARVQWSIFAADQAVLEKNLDAELFWVREARRILGKRSLDEIDVRALARIPTIQELVLREGGVLERQNRVKEAIECYAKAIDNQIRGNSILYAHARALLKRGDRPSKNRAVVSLKAISKSKDEDLWKPLAQKVLEGVTGSSELDAKEGRK